MRIIQKTVLLEQVTSRVPSIWPAYKENKLYFFDEESLKKRGYEYPTNYGMIPLSLSILPSMSGYTISSSVNAFKMSFEKMCEYYAFFKEYNHFLNSSSYCDRSFSSATEYYNTVIDTKYANQMEYGQNEETYIELDENYKKMGGNGLFELIRNSVIPTYQISKEYRDYWKKDYLYYSDVIQWITWFKDREHYENDANYYSGKTGVEVPHWTCKNSGITDCCDCEEYFNRGGARELSAMTTWYNTIQANINEINEIIINDPSSFTPSFLEQIVLENSLDNIGQYSVLAPEYEEGIDYRGADYGDSANTKGGTVVIDSSGSTKILKDDVKGFCFCPFYMEKIIDDNAWEDYTERYISGNPEEFVSSSYTYYAFDEENRFYSGETQQAVIESMRTGESYSVTSADSILIDDELIPIKTSEFGIYDPTNNILGGRIYFVHREKDTYTPYTVINGRKIYADSYLSTSGMCYYFSFFLTDNANKTANSCHNDASAFNIENYKIFGRRKTTKSLELIDYIAYNDKTYVIGNVSSITINGISYPRISGYAYDKDENIIYISNGKLYDSNFNILPSEYSLSYNNKTINVNVYNQNVTIYNAKEITGQTISKLLDLASDNKLCDDTGNDIDGIYNDSCRKINNQGESSAMTYSQPPMYTVLEPLYQVGNTSLIGKFKLTEEDVTKLSASTACNYFIGNIITSMNFYYKDIEGNKINGTSVECSDSVTSLSAITSATTAKDNIDAANQNIIFDDSLYCDIEYYIGATLKRMSGSPFMLADGYNYGVKYNETVKFNKKQVFFKLKTEPEVVAPTQKYDTENLSHKYPIFIYEIEQEMLDVGDDIYNTSYQVPLAKFTTEINLIDENLTPNFSEYEDMDTYNGVKVAPVYKEEYKMGLSMMEKVDSDIYIDRGINAAFEKHLKLQEIDSLDSLENFGNGFFKIMNS